jgi:hypothetical protein
VHELPEHDVPLSEKPESQAGGEQTGRQTLPLHECPLGHPQSVQHPDWVSPVVHVPSPHEAQEPQSAAHEPQFSVPAHAPFPQYS